MKDLSLLSLLVNGLFLILFIYLVFSIGYLLLIAIAGRFYKPRRYTSHPNKKKIAVLIPSYKEDSIIVDTARRALQQDYPAGAFDVFVIADQLQNETISKLRALPVNVVEVKFEISMKSKSLNEAFNTINEKEYEIAFILDADNVMEKGCLEMVNHAFNEGFKAVQCHRTAKNKNNSVAVLDAVSEAINNNLFRSGQRSLGFSATLMGSGMGFEFNEIKEIFSREKILNDPTEDREVDLQLMRKNIIVEYLDDALVYDEKVSSAAVFQKQRTRWMEAQVKHCKRFFNADINSSPKTKSYWSKFFQTIILPRSLFIVLFALLMTLVAVNIFLKTSFLFPGNAWWIGLAAAFAASLFISVPSRFFNAATAKALGKIPVLLFAMVRAMFKMKANRKEFVHTPKMYTAEEAQALNQTV